MQVNEASGIEYRLNIRLLARNILTDYQFFFLFLRIVDNDFQHETIDLRFGKRIRSFLFNRVLCSHYEKRFRKFIGRFADRHLTFLHGFEQRTLHLGRSTVDFVGQYEVREYRTLLDKKFFAFLTVYHRPDHVGRQQVRCKLDTTVFSVD